MLNTVICKADKEGDLDEGGRTDRSLGLGEEAVDGYEAVLYVLLYCGDFSWSERNGAGSFMAEVGRKEGNASELTPVHALVSPVPSSQRARSQRARVCQ